MLILLFVYTRLIEEGCMWPCERLSNKHFVFTIWALISINIMIWYCFFFYTKQTNRSNYYNTQGKLKKTPHNLVMCYNSFKITILYSRFEYAITGVVCYHRSRCRGWWWRARPTSQCQCSHPQESDSLVYIPQGWPSPAWGRRKQGEENGRYLLMGCWIPQSWPGNPLWIDSSKTLSLY